ncbi:MAG: HupE/UreJ family protein [Chromatiales bacterium]|jgi:urease accessory protein
MKSLIKSSLFTVTALTASLPAQAHHMMDGQTPETFMQGMLSGLAHPVIGIDHFAFVLMVGLLAVALSGMSKYLMPAAFVGATIAGTGLHLAAADLPAAELIIAFSVLSAGALVLLRKQLPVLLLGIGVAGFGLFHGYAYGESIVGAETGVLAAYLIGFSLIQYALVIGITLGMEKIAARSERVQLLATRGAAALATVTGAVFLAMNMA